MNLAEVLAERYDVMAVLKLDKHDEEREIEFELAYLASLTTQERFELMFWKNQ